MITATIISFVVLFDRSVLSVPRAQRLFRQSAAIIQRDVPEIEIRAFRFKRVKDTPRIPVQQQNIALGLLSPVFNRHSPIGNTVLLAPPGYSDLAPNVEYAIGQAIICGGRGYIAVVKKGHWMMNVIGLAHEMGHMLGAQHTPDDTGVMNRSLFFLRFSTTGRLSSLNNRGMK